MNRYLLVSLAMLGCRLGVTTHVDKDGDGWCVPPGEVWSQSSHVCEGGEFGDCDDDDPARHPDAFEACNGIDDNCDGDPEGLEADADGDGLLVCEGDCHDEDPALPSDEIPDNGIDEDCSGFADDDPLTDVDADGHPVPEDCNDLDPTIFPGANERCNGLDDDCDELIDEGVTIPEWWPDLDGDGVGALGDPVITCDPGDGFVTETGDCDDTDAEIKPDGLERCNLVDDDCDGEVDEGLDPVAVWRDPDEDGHATADALESFGCPQAVGWSILVDDCAEGDPSVSPSALEVCDGEDQDCDGEIDEGLPLIDWRPDRDGDGFGDARVVPATTCADLSFTFVSEGGDCDDDDPNIYEGAPELCNTRDDDCDGDSDEGLPTTDWYVDTDGDGHGEQSGSVLQTCEDLTGTHATTNDDCDDTDGSVFPSAPELCNAADDNCDGAVDEGVTPPSWWPDLDQDGDGDGSVPPQVTCQALSEMWVQNDDDCDDLRADISSSAVEVCNGIDDNCDGGIDEAIPTEVWYLDLDGDGYGVSTNTEDTCLDRSTTHALVDGDCDDYDPTSHPNAIELCDGIDHDCSGDPSDHAALASWWLDDDGDGYGDGDLVSSCFDLSATHATRDGDCDDDDDQVRPGAAERCNGVSDDCDSEIDEGVVVPTWWVDDDADGWGGASTVVACEAPEGWVDRGGDCDDMSSQVRPDANEQCNMLDDDCDGTVDNGFVLLPMRRDADGDDYGASGSGVLGCSEAGGWSTQGGDCDDDNGAVHPGVEVENCDGVDEDCNGDIDDGVPTSSWWLDADGDGYGVGSPTITCEDRSEGFANAGGDCDDDDADRHPNNPERCDGLDQDCQRGPDNDLDFVDWWPDVDGDGYGDDLELPVNDCAAPTENHVDQAGDCDDQSSAANPSRTEVCNGIDDDCVGGADDGLVFTTWYIDADGDGQGDSSLSTASCEALTGSYTTWGGDCDDTRPEAYDGAPELCNGLDDDCDLQVDEGLVPEDWWPDDDGDGFGAQSGAINTCDPPEGYLLDNTDCDDQQAATFPGAPELCDGLDNNCSGAADDTVTTSTWWQDADADGYGDAASTSVQDCVDRTADGYVSNDDDCDDQDRNVYPGAPELCNEQDEDCDGTPDNGIDIPVWYPDADGDDYGAAGPIVTSCFDVAGHTNQPDDCDDGNAQINPSASEQCDGVDENCDGARDDGFERVQLFVDDDNDGVGVSGASIIACDSPGWAPTVGDCRDDDPAIYPGAEELCDSIDNNCSGVVDDTTDRQLWWPDGDQDGVGASTGAVLRCADPSRPFAQWSLETGDCDDGNPNRFPGNPEICNGLDENCANGVDDGLYTRRLWPDLDGDGWGDRDETGVMSCADGTGFAERGRDCDDSDPLANPGQTEVCDGDFDDCAHSTEPPCPEVTAFRANAWRGPALLDFSARHNSNGTECDTDTTTWLSRWARADEDDNLAYVPYTRIHLEWDTENATSVDIPALSLTGLPASGSLSTNVDPDGPIEVFAFDNDGNEESETLDTTPVDLPWPGVDDAPPNTCFEIDLPSLFPGRPSNSPRGPSTVVDCGTELDRFTDHPDCAGCLPPVPNAGAWSFMPGVPNSLSFRENQNIPAADGEYVVSSYPILVPSTADIWVYGLVWAEHAEAQVRVTFTDPNGADICDLSGTTVPSSYIYPGQDVPFEWNFGRGQETRAAFGSHSDASGGKSFAQLSLAVRTKASTYFGSATFEDLTMYCCGPGCGVCVNDDTDQWGLWCPAGGWDCDETDGLSYPGSLYNDCTAQDWYQNRCPNP